MAVTNETCQFLSENDVSYKISYFLKEIFYFWHYNIKYNILQAQEQNDKKKLHTS